MDSVDSTEVEDGIQDRASPSTSTRPRPEEGESVEKRQSPGLVLGVGLGMGTKQRKRKRIKVVGRLARTSRLCVESKGEGEAKGGGTDVDSTCTTMAMAMAIPVSSMLRDETPSRYETLSGQSGHDGHDGHEEERGIEAGSGNERRRKKGKTDGKGSSTPTAVSPGERAGERLMGKWETERKQERERKQEKEWKSKWKWEQASTDGLQPNNEPDGLGDTRKEGRTVEQGSEGEEEADVKGESGGIGESGRRGTKEVGPPRAPPVWSEVCDVVFLQHSSFSLFS